MREQLELAHVDAELLSASRGRERQLSEQLKALTEELLQAKKHHTPVREGRREEGGEGREGRKGKEGREGRGERRGEQGEGGEEGEGGEGEEGGEGRREGKGGLKT